MCAIDTARRAGSQLEVNTGRQEPKLLTASASDSYVSKTVNNFVIASRSVIRLVRLTRFSVPPWRLTVV